MNPGTPAQPEEKKSRRRTAEQLRAGTSMTRELALSLLTADDRVIFEKFLEGDQQAMETAKKAHVASALFNAHLHARADKLEVTQVIERTVSDVEDISSLLGGMVQVTAGPGVAVVTPAQLGLPSGPGSAPSGGITGSLPTGLPTGLNGLFPTSMQQPGTMGTVSTPGLATAQDVQDAINHWQSIYGPMRGEFRYDVFVSARNAESKVGMMTLMDMGIVNDECVHEIPWRFPDKQYARAKDHDILREPYLVSILKKESIPLLEALVEHAQGISMLKKGQERLLSYTPGSVVSYEDKSLLKCVYRTQDMLFDEVQVELLDKFISYIGGANMSKPDDHVNPPRSWMTFLAYKANEGDIPTLQMLVDKHNLKLNVYDQYGGTPYLRAASMGNLPLLRFLQANPPIDVLAEERMNSHSSKTALDYAEEGPVRRAQEQDYTKRQNEEDALAYQDTTLPAWEKAVAEALAAGKEPPKQPDMPEPDPIPEDYPLEIISIVQDAFANADPTMFAKTKTDPMETKFGALDDLGGDDLNFSDM